MSAYGKEWDEQRTELTKLIRHNSRKKHTRGSAVNRRQNIPDTVAVEQCDPGVRLIDAFTQTPLNQQTQKTSRPGIEIFSQTTREVGAVGEYDKEPIDPRTHPWEHPTLFPTTRSRDREQGTSENQERETNRTGWRAKCTDTVRNSDRKSTSIYTHPSFAQ